MRVATTTDMALAISAAANNNEWLMPLYLSSLAGASTCLGAAIVFWHPQRHKIGAPNTMSFSLALAGSVMITVSVLSLGPECLRDVTSIPSSSSSSSHYPFQIMPLWSSMFLERIVSFGMGCFLYWILSYFAFPDPESLVLEFSKEEEENVAAREPASCHDGVLQDDASIHHNGQVHDVSSSKKQQPFSVRSRKASSQALAATDSSSDRFNNEEKGQTTTTTTLAQPLLLLLPQRDDDDDDDSYHKSPPLNNKNNNKNKNNTTMTLSQWSSGADLQNAQQKRAWRVAMLLFCSLLIHNFPEGLAVAASSVQSTKLGMQVAFGILIHNIPEGIAIAVPCLAARPDRPWLAFLLASGSGLAEPLGAAVALLVWKNAHHRVLPMENVLSFVAGIMVTVALCELFPEAKRYDAKMYFALGTITGIGIMTATELCFPE
jgi:ZIP family zinc transporter